MDFTREPIIETVITPREGYKLVLRNSKIGGQEEFTVEAVEVITFGKNAFFRSLEKPKNFLLPVNDYELIEMKEMRFPLKTPAVEQKVARETFVKKTEEVEQKEEKPRERKRLRKKREPEEGELMKPSPSLIPPPSTLIRETLARHKETLLPVEDEVRVEEVIVEQAQLPTDEEIPF